MSNFDSILTSLNSKIEKLIIMHQDLKEENLRISKENEELDKLNKTLKTKIETLNTNAPGNGKSDLADNAEVIDKKILVERINELALEVDNCLSLLDK